MRLDLCKLAQMALRLAEPLLVNETDRRVFRLAMDVLHSGWAQKEVVGFNQLVGELLLTGTSAGPENEIHVMYPVGRAVMLAVEPETPARGYLSRLGEIAQEVEFLVNMTRREDTGEFLRRNRSNLSVV